MSEGRKLTLIVLLLAAILVVIFFRMQRPAQPTAPFFGGGAATLPEDLSKTPIAENTKAKEYLKIACQAVQFRHYTSVASALRDLQGEEPELRAEAGTPTVKLPPGVLVVDIVHSTPRRLVVLEWSETGRMFRRVCVTQ